MTDFSDPYDTIRAAWPIMKMLAMKGDKDAMAWMKMYRKLPGATLSHKEIHLLKDSTLRCSHNEDAVEKLQKSGYLKNIEIMSGYPKPKPKIYTRLNDAGKDAIRLRSDVGVKTKWKALKS